MLVLLWLTMASANDLPFPRMDDALRPRRYARVVGDGPVWGQWRQRAGAVEAWVFPDGSIEHFNRYDNRVRVEQRAYDPHGRLAAAITYVDAAPTAVDVARPSRTLDVSAWPPIAVGALTTRAPTPPATTSPERLTWKTDTWTASVSVTAGPVDVFSDAFRDGLAEACACDLEDRTTVWASGVPGSRYRVRVRDVSAPMVGEITSVPRADRVYVVTYLTTDAFADGADGSDPGLARGRAMLALVEWAAE